MNLILLFLVASLPSILVVDVLTFLSFLKSITLLSIKSTQVLEYLPSYVSTHKIIIKMNYLNKEISLFF